MDLKDLKDQISYLIGRDMAANFAKQGIDVNPEVLGQAMKEAQEGKPSSISPEQAQQVMQQLQQQMAQKQGSKGQENLEKGKKFLEENKNKEGVKTLASGLQYQVLQEGNGKSPSSKDQVTTHYHGTLIDGTVFDSSYARNQPATFPVNGVIAGWTEALQLMKEGAKWRLFVPAQLAYGAQGAGDAIGPNETLIFDVELIKVG